MNIPTLKSSILELVPLSLEAESAYIQFYTDKEASQNYGGPLTHHAAFNRLLSDAGSWQILGFGVWAIRSLELKQIVGVCGFWQGKGWPTELTWWLLPEVRGKGFAKEASNLAIRHAYQNWKWDNVRTYMNDNNDAARKLVLALGGNFLHRDVFPDGLERDIFIFPREKYM